MNRRHRLVRLLAAVLASAALLPSPAVAGVNDLLPDLRMAPIFGVELRTSPNGHKHLRFGTIVYNEGDGPLEVHGRNAQGTVMRRVVQAIKQGDGNWRKVVKPDAKVFYAGDGHDHWHIARFNRATLTALPGTPATDLRLRKIGFCLVDSFTMTDPPPGTPPVRTYADCGVRKSPSVTMGISVGWGDIYAPETRFQDIDVTGLPAGDYRLCTTTNRRGLWKEKDNNYTNNSSWMDLQINVATGSVTPKAEGTTPC